MQSRTERIDTPEVIAVTGIIEHDGREYASGGGYISPDYVIAYATPHTEEYRREHRRWSAGYLTLWDGTQIGHYTVISRWKRWSSLGPYTMAAVEATIHYGPAQGTYHGRYGPDWAELVRLRKSKRQA